MSFKKLNVCSPCCCKCSDVDLLMLTDSTGSMQGRITAIQTLFRDLRTSFDSTSCRFAVAEYRDFEDGPPDFNLGWRIQQTFTNNYDLVIDALDRLTAEGGGDAPEQNYDALKNTGEYWVSELEGRTEPNIRRICVWCGDSAGWNGTNPNKTHVYPTQAEVITALRDGYIRVFAVGVGINGSAGADNEYGQAEAICAATGGKWYGGPYAYKELRKAICAAFRKPPVPVPQGN